MATYFGAKTGVCGCEVGCFFRKHFCFQNIKFGHLRVSQRNVRSLEMPQFLEAVKCCCSHNGFALDQGAGGLGVGAEGFDKLGGVGAGLAVANQALVEGNRRDNLGGGSG